MPQEPAKHKALVLHLASGSWGDCGSPDRLVTGSSDASRSADGDGPSKACIVARWTAATDDGPCSPGMDQDLDVLPAIRAVLTYQERDGVLQAVKG